MKPTVSIIIPAYNAEATLARCLKSVLTQSLREIEVLCVNDGSTDGTGEILKRWAERDGRIRVRQLEENIGIVPAENLGIRASTGEYVMFVDADDRLLQGACENAVRLIREYDVDILQFNVKVNVPPGTDGFIWKKLLTSKEWTSEGVNILYDCYSLRRIPYTIWNKIYRGEVCRAAAASMPDLQISLAADVLQEFFFFYYARTFRSVTDGPYYEYYVGNGISTHAPDAKQFAQICAASIILPAIEEFLRSRNEYETHRFLLDSVAVSQKTFMLSMLLALPEITKETIDLAVKTWGSEVLYDFIKYTGLLEVKCKSRLNLIPVLVEQIRKQQKNKSTTSARETTLTVGG